MIGGVMVFVGAAVAYLAMTFVDSGYGLQASNQAESIATAGVNDTFLRLARNQALSTSSVATANGTATVTVTQGSPVAGEVTVLSSATVGSRTRKVSAIFSISSTTGQVTLTSWQDVQ